MTSRPVQRQTDETDRQTDLVMFENFSAKPEPTPDVTYTCLDMRVTINLLFKMPCEGSAGVCVRAAGRRRLGHVTLAPLLLGGFSLGALPRPTPRDPNPLSGLRRAKSGC